VASEGSAEQNRDLTNKKSDIRHPWSDERATNREVQNPSKAMAVDPAGVRGRRSNLPGEVCVMFRSRKLRAPRGALTVAQKSADGIVGQDVGKASEALQRRKGGATDRAEPERGPKARTIGSGK